MRELYAPPIPKEGDHPLHNAQAEAEGGSLRTDPVQVPLDVQVDVQDALQRVREAMVRVEVLREKRDKVLGLSSSSAVGGS